MADQAGPRKGARPRPLLTAVVVGLVFYALPKPAEVSVKGWRMTAIFGTTILAIALEPLPVGAIAITSLTFAVATGTISFAAGMAGMSNEVIWLVVVAFFLAKAFEKTRLATRIALLFVRACGRTALGLAYGVILAELVLGLAMPSSAARSAGVLYPLVLAMAEEAGDAKIGGFLVLSTFQATAHSSALWVTGAATNFLSLDLARGLGVEIGESDFAEWLWPSVVPALLGVVASPVLAARLCPPMRRQTPELPRRAREKLQDMGPMSRDERVLLVVVVVMVVLWSGASASMRPVTTALLGLTALLVFGVLDWKDCSEDKKVWDIFVWFSLLVGLSAQLNSLGVTEWFAKSAGCIVESSGLPWKVTLPMIAVAYFYSHYLFASQVAHISALYQPTAAILIATGCPPKLAVLSLAYLNNVFATLTNYSSAQAPVFYAAGFFSLRRWWQVNFIFSVCNITIWLCAGGLWWHIIGLASEEGLSVNSTAEATD